MCTCVECTCSVCEDACDVFGGTAGPIVQFIRAGICDFANVYPTNLKLDLSLRTGAQIMSCICVLCVVQLLSVCVYDLCLWIASSSELSLSFSTSRDTIHSGHYS